MDCVTVSAPGKLMVMGEYAVLHGQRCIVTAVEQRMCVTLTLIPDSVLAIEAPDVKLTGYVRPLSSLGEGTIPAAARFIEHAVRAVHAAHPLRCGVRIETSSQFSSQMGFGSSSASAVCAVKGLLYLFDIPHTDGDVFSTTFRVIRAVQGTGSGFDVASAVYGGTLLYSVSDGMIERLPSLPLVIGYSGTKADTVTMINAVNTRLGTPGFVRLFPAIGSLVDAAAHAETVSTPTVFGAFMNANQALLRALDVSTPTLDAMVDAARGAGAYGAKLSGAGGGDCMIALVDEDNRRSVADAIRNAGGAVIDVVTGTDGLRVDSHPVSSRSA